ncbi:MAG: hypothetical protein JRE64_22405 [Deltaproteobacteria bacterium]|nr:hypothetical protein [Deltaproteobacteria bacterium]
MKTLDLGLMAVVLDKTKIIRICFLQADQAEKGQIEQPEHDDDDESY